MTKATVYICEDDPHLGHTIQLLIQQQNFECLLFTDANELDAQCAQRLPDLLLLDNELPGESGFSIAKRYGHIAPTVRVIMMSVLNQQHHLAQGYEAGAMLYLPKPFEPEALLACLDGIFKPLQKPDVILIMETNRLHHPHGIIELSASETKLLSCLSLQSPNVVEYYEIMEAIGLDLDSNKKTSLEVIVSRLRRKLKQITVDSITISNKQSLGYALAHPLHIRKIS